MTFDVQWTNEQTVKVNKINDVCKNKKAQPHSIWLVLFILSNSN